MRDKKPTVKAANAWQKVRVSVVEALPVAIKTGWWLIRLIIPVSLAVLF